MPLYDYLGGTMDKSTDALYHSVRQGNSLDSKQSSWKVMHLVQIANV